MTLERLDVRIKIAVFVVIMIALFVFSHPLGNLALLVILLAALIAGQRGDAALAALAETETHLAASRVHWIEKESP